jgi:tetratricopeptide (TPR) repeat protein
MNLDLATRLESDIDAALSRGDLDEAEVLAQRYRAEASDEDGSGPSPRFRSRYLAAQVALAGGRLTEAGRRFASIMPLPADLPPALVCRIWLMSAEVLARLHRESEARGHLNRAQAFPTALAENPLLKLREIRIRLWLGEVEELAADMAACGQALHQRGDLEHLTLLTCEEGRAWDARDRLDRASACWTRAEEMSRSLGANAARADALIQLGRWEHLRGNLQAALDRYDQAAASLVERGERSELTLPSASPASESELRLADTRRGRSPGARAQWQEAHLRRLLVLLDLNQWGQARDGLEQTLADTCIEQLPEEVQPVARMVSALLQGTQEQAGSETDAYQAALRGDVALAKGLYERALEESRAPARRARLAMALGMLALAVRDENEAKRWLNQAETLATREDLPEVLWRTIQARGQLAAEIEGDDEQAHALFERAVLLSEAQLHKLTHRADAVTHGLRRGEILRKLLHAACRRGDAARVFHYQERERGRFLLELWRASPTSASTARWSSDPRLADLDKRIADLDGEIDLAGVTPPSGLLHRREELLLQRDRLFDAWLRDRSKASAALPALPDIEDLQRSIPPGTVYIAPSMVEDELYLLVCRSAQPPQVICAPGSALALAERIAQLRSCLDGQLERYRRGFPLGALERAELDARLEALGQSCLGDALGQVLDTGGPPERIIFVPDGVLHGVPLHALRPGGRYLIEKHEVVCTFGGALLVHQRRSPPKRRLFSRALVVTESPEVLPAAAREGEGVAATFWRSRLLHGEKANHATLRRHLPDTSVVHLACHAWFDARHPLSASISLPSGETWRALDWLDEPLDGLPLVTLSACRSAEVGALAGREVFGLVTGLLGSGVRSVVAGLWPVADREALPFMWRFYRERLDADVPLALARAQRAALSQLDSSPLFWGAFALFGDGDALPAPQRWWRWLARWRQRKHARRFPTESQRSLTGA